MIKKLVTLMLACLLTFSCVSCTNNKQNGSTSDSSGENTTIIGGNSNTQYAQYDYSSGINKNGNKYAIVENGVAKYSIIIPATASDEIVAAAGEFNQYIFETSGVYLSIAKEGSETPSKFISFGETAAKKAAGIDTSKIKHDGFTIKTVDGNVYLAANIDRGVQYAAYSFLERFLGIRWLTARETYILPAKTITVQECDIVEEPLFAMRNWMNGDYQNTEYTQHMRYYTGSGLWCNDVSAVHNTTDMRGQPGIGWVNKSDIAPDGNGTDTLGTVHPEYFSDYTNHGSTHYEICFTSGIDENGSLTEGQSVASLMIAKMKKFLTADSEKKAIQYMMVGHVDDSAAYCQCDNCMERRELYKDSGVLIIFLNAVVREVNEWLMETQGRTVTVVTFAYQYTEVPPVKEKDDGSYEPISPLVVCDENLAIRIAPIEADFTYSFTDERQLLSHQLVVKGWPAVCKSFMSWDYAANFAEYYWYFPDLNFMKSKLETYRDMGLFYCMFQSSYTQTGIWHDELRSYIFSRLAWNINWDIDYLINEYLELYYGVAADSVKAVIQSFEDFYTEQRNNGTLHVGLFAAANYIQNNNNQNPKAWVTSLVRMLELAIKKVEGDATLSNNQKSALIYKLEEVLMTPKCMIMRNYTSYYLNGKVDYAIQFFDMVDAHGIKYFGETEANSVATRKRANGLA